MTPTQLAARLARIENALLREIARAETETLKQAKREAVRLSSGPYSQADLNKAGNPYARRAPNSSYVPTIINKGKGKGVFRVSWVTDGPKVTTRGIVSRLSNSDPASKYLLGTRVMVSRDMRARIVKAVQADRQRRLREAVARAITA